jgi:Flp pilus assembly pilin Flp
MLGAKKTVKTLARGLASEDGGAAMEMALLIGLSAFFAFTLRHVLAAPLLDTFTRAARVVSEALSG